MARTKQTRRETTNSNEKKFGGGRHWRKDIGGQDGKSSYDRLWDYLLDNDGKYLRAFKGIPWKGDTQRDLVRQIMKKKMELDQKIKNTELRIQTRLSYFNQYADKHHLSLEERDAFTQKVLDEELKE